MHSLPRPARVDEASALAELAAATFPLACPPNTDPEAIATHIATRLNSTVFSAWISSSDHVLLLIEDDNAALLGYALIAREVPAADVATIVGTGPAIELSKIYVHPRAHGTGVADELMRTCLAAAGDVFDADHVWLGTNERNQRAQSFYRRYGFTVNGRRGYVVGGDLQCDVVMTWRRPPQTPQSHDEPPA